VTLRQDIHSVTSKANRILGLIKRSFSFLDTDTFTKLFKALVRPHLEYGNAIWHPLFKKQSIAVERVQRRGTKFLANLKNLTYVERLKEVNLPSLKFRRLRGDLIQTFKIVNGVDKLDTNTFFQFTSYDKTRNSTNKIYINRYRTNLRKNCFSNRIAPYWNKLPTHVKNAKDVNHFKNLLEQVQFIQDLKFLYDE